MDEESSDHMDEAGIPMLVSGYNIIITMGSKLWGPGIYTASNTEWGRISIYGRGVHSHAHIKIYKNNYEARKGGPVGYINNHCVYHKGPEGTQIWDILLGWPCLSWKTDAPEWQQCYWMWYQRNWWAVGSEWQGSYSQWYTELELNWVLKEAWNWMASEYNRQRSSEIHRNI